MKHNVVVFPKRDRLGRMEDAENRCMRGCHSTGKRWFYAGAAWGMVLLLFVLVTA